MCLGVLLFVAAPTWGKPARDGFRDPASMERPTIRAVRIEEGPRIDGRLDDPQWQQAEVGTNFVQRDPLEGEPATQDTFFRVLFTQSALYIGVDARDSEPHRVIANQMSRDASLFSEDSISIMLDTFLDRRNFFRFETNPNGSRGDALVTDEGRDFNREWDGVWDVVSRRTDQGWVAELEIPFSTLRFDPTQTTWGLQIRRSVARTNEGSFWAPIPRGFSSFRISLAGTLTGLEGLLPSRQLDIKPFVTANAVDSEEDGTSEDGDAGLDVKWGVTRSTRLDLTYNTDFAEVEVDQQQVNLTRFSLFFPERREFFLENAGIFEFGPGGGGFGRGRRGGGAPLLKVFFSRRIGIDSEGVPVPVDWGARYTGRVGGWNFGVLDVQTEAAVTSEGEEVGQTNFAVVRAKRNLGERSSVGVIYTDRRESGAGKNQVLGVDFDYKPTNKISFNGNYVQSDDEDAEPDEEDWSGGIGFNYEARGFEASFDATQVSGGFEPGIGFLLRRDVRRYKPNVEWDPLINKGFIRTLRFGVESEYVSNTSGLMESREHEVDFFGFRTQRGDSFSLSVADQTERLVEDFQITDEVTIPAGRYDFDERWSARTFTSSSRPVSFFGSVSSGGFYNGTNDRTSANIQLNPSKHFEISTGVQVNDITLPEAEFQRNVFSQRLSVTATPNVLLDSLLQYNEASELLGLNVRFNWIYKPGADLFVVYNQRWDAPTFSSRETVDRQVIVKFTYLIQR